MTKIKDMIPINGRESSILALLAQCCQNLGLSKETKKCLDCLKNEESLHSYRIGCLIVGTKINNPTNYEINIANGLKNWANNIGKHKSSKSKL